MERTKMLLSCIMMLMFSVSVFAGQCQGRNKNLDCMSSLQDEKCCQFGQCCQEEQCCQADQCCNKNDILFMCDSNMPQEKCQMFKQHHFKKCFMRNFNEDCVECFKKGFCKKIFKKINLTDKQKEDLKTLIESTMKKQQELMKTIMNEWKTIDEELVKEKSSEKVIKRSVKNIKDASNKIIDNKITKKQSLKKIFTNEQYIKMFKPKTRYDMLAERLDLSKEQKEKVTTIMEDNDKKIKELIDKKFEKKNLLNEELEKEKCNKDTVSQLMKDISLLSDEVFKLKIDMKTKLKSVLSLEQYSKMNNFHKKDKFAPAKNKV